MRRPNRREFEDRRPAGPRPARLIVGYDGGQSEASAPRATVVLVSTDAWRDVCSVLSWGETRALAVERAIRHAYDCTGVVYVPEPQEHGWTAARARRELEADCRPVQTAPKYRRAERARARELAARRQRPRPARLIVPYHGGQSEASAPRATVVLVSTDAWREICTVESWGESRALAVERAIRYAYERTGFVYIPQPREHGWTAARARRELDADDA